MTLTLGQAGMSWFFLWTINRAELGLSADVKQFNPGLFQMNPSSIKWLPEIKRKWRSADVKNFVSRSRPDFILSKNQNCCRIRHQFVNSAVFIYRILTGVVGALKMRSESSLPSTDSSLGGEAKSRDQCSRRIRAQPCRELLYRRTIA